MPQSQQVVLDSEQIRRKIRRMALAIVESTGGNAELALIGIRRGGVPLAQRIAEQIEVAEGHAPQVGSVDIALYRDDAATAFPDPKIGPSDIPFDLQGRHVVLVDDVLQTGRTVRAAIECLQDHGRPARIWLAALCDRGGRELPIAADFVGRQVELREHERIEVWIQAAGEDRVTIVQGES